MHACQSTTSCSYTWKRTSNRRSRAKLMSALPNDMCQVKIATNLTNRRTVCTLAASFTYASLCNPMQAETWTPASTMNTTCKQQHAGSQQSGKQRPHIDQQKHSSRSKPSVCNGIIMQKSNSYEGPIPHTVHSPITGASERLCGMLGRYEGAGVHHWHIRHIWHKQG